MRQTISWAAIFLVALTSADSFAAGMARPASPARLLDGPHVTVSPVRLADTDHLSCFEADSLTLILNPGCFVTSNPDQPGDCTSRPGHFLVQYVFPDVPSPASILRLGFINNDASTVFPSVGLLLIPLDNQGNARFPTQQELDSLPFQNIRPGVEADSFFVDVTSQNILVQPGDEVALVVALEFPATGRLTTVGAGPGIAVDAKPPDQLCDLFTIDAGVTWFEPAPCAPGDPSCRPLDWGFVLEYRYTPPDAVESITWSHVKTLYRTP